MKYIVIFLLFLLGCPTSTKKYPDGGSLLRQGDIVHINSTHASIQSVDIVGGQLVRIKTFGNIPEHRHSTTHLVRYNYLKKCDCK